MKWQPIDTAPKDRRILVFNSWFGVYSSQYTVEREHLGDDDRRRTSERPVKWTGYPLGLTDIGLGRWYCVPTHWMPLPEPPQEQRE